MKTLMTAILFGSLLISSASAQSLRREQCNNERRIWNGARTGQLTPREAARLDYRQRQLDRQYARDVRDGGGLSYAERRALERRQDQLDRSTWRNLHDNDRQWRW